MAKNRWFKFFPSDFLTAIRSLNPIEITAYIVVLCELYDHEGIVRRDDAHLASACRIRKTDFTRALDSLIARGKIDVASGLLSNKRVSEEVQKRIVVAEDKARLRRDGDMAVTRARHEQAGKGNKNKLPMANVRPYIEERIKNSPSLDVEACLPREPVSAAEQSQRALEGYQKRNRLRKSKH